MGACTSAKEVKTPQIKKELTNPQILTPVKTRLSTSTLNLKSPSLSEALRPTPLVTRHLSSAALNHPTIRLVKVKSISANRKLSR